MSDLEACCGIPEYCFQQVIIRASRHSMLSSGDKGKSSKSMVSSVGVALSQACVPEGADPIAQGESNEADDEEAAAYDRCSRGRIGLSSEIVKRLVGSLALLAPILFLVSCAGAPEEAGWTTPKVPEELSTTLALSALPFDSFALGETEREQLQRGTAKLLNRCLADFGLAAQFSGDYIQQLSEDPTDPFIYQWGGRWGTLSLDQASEYGYAAPPGGIWSNGSGIYLSSAENLNPVMPNDVTEAAQLSAAMYGPDQGIVMGEGGDEQPLSNELIPLDQSGDPPPADGCYGVVESQIAVPFVDLRNLTSEIYGLTFAQEDVKEVARAWSTCMKNAGFEYARFEEAPLANSGAITPETITVAIADVECTEAGRWPDTFYFVLADYEQQAIDKQPEILQSALDAERGRLEKVNALLGE